MCNVINQNFNINDITLDLSNCEYYDHEQDDETLAFMCKDCINQICIFKTEKNIYISEKCHKIHIDDILDLIDKNIEKLTFKENCYLKNSKLPNHLKQIIFNNVCNKRILNKLPLSLETLIINVNFFTIHKNLIFNNLPPRIKNVIVCMHYYNNFVKKTTDKIKKIRFNKLPTTLKSVNFDFNKNRNIMVINDEHNTHKQNISKTIKHIYKIERPKSLLAYQIHY